MMEAKMEVKRRIDPINTATPSLAFLRHHSHALLLTPRPSLAIETTETIHCASSCFAVTRRHQPLRCDIVQPAVEVSPHHRSCDLAGKDPDPPGLKCNVLDLDGMTQYLDQKIPCVPFVKNMGDLWNCGIENSRESRIFVTRIVELHVKWQADYADLS
jgi:hypothetical protein